MSLTGQRGDRLILDDPHSTITAESPDVRHKTTRQFREGATNRLNDLKTSAIVVIMQRLHEDDVSGVILALKLGYVHLMLPMEFEPERACETSIGFKDPRTYDGELLQRRGGGLSVLGVQGRESRCPEVLAGEAGWLERADHDRAFRCHRPL